MSQCAFVDPCPNNSINPIYKRTVIHATSQKVSVSNINYINALTFSPLEKIG